MIDRLKFYWKVARRLSLTAYRYVNYRLLGMFKDYVTIRTKQGILTVATRDEEGLGAFLYCQRQHEYEASLRSVRFLRDNALIKSPNTTMVDIGANLGVIGIGLALAGEVNRVLAVEPEPTNFALLRRNIEQNSLSARVLGLQLAVGEASAVLSMELSPRNRGDHRIRISPALMASENQRESARQVTQVKALSLPQILALDEVKKMDLSSPSFLWIDVQGYEGYVFRGAASLLGNGLPTICEIWPYGILRAGMELDTFSQIIESLWSNYWIERRDRFTNYPTTVFRHYLNEIGRDGHFENVIFTGASR